MQHRRKNVMSNPSADEVLNDPTASHTQSRRWDDKGRRWVAPVVIVSLVVGLAGLGVGAYAVATTPAKTSGPQGPVGKTGATGPQGQQGLPGEKGEPGPAGALAATSIVASTALKSIPDPAVGTVLVAKTSCPAGKILLSGGAQVSAPGLEADRNVELRSSFPFSTTQWQTVAIVTGSLGAGVVMTMKPYVVCGEATPATTSTTPSSTTTTSTTPSSTTPTT
jgi:hypothetical protein